MHDYWIEPVELEHISEHLVFRMATLELKLAMVEMVEMLLPLQWVVRVVAGMLLLPLMRSTSLRPLTTQALSTSKSRFEKIVGNGIKEIDHLKLIITLAIYYGTQHRHRRK